MLFSRRRERGFQVVIWFSLMIWCFMFLSVNPPSASASYLSPRSPLSTKQKNRIVTTTNSDRESAREGDTESGLGLHLSVPVSSVGREGDKWEEKAASGCIRRRVGLIHACIILVFPRFVCCLKTRKERRVFGNMSLTVK